MIILTNKKLHNTKLKYHVFFKSCPLRQLDLMVEFFVPGKPRTLNTSFMNSSQSTIKQYVSIHYVSMRIFLIVIVCHFNILSDNLHYSGIVTLDLPCPEIVILDILGPEIITLDLPCPGIVILDIPCPGIVMLDLPCPGIVVLDLPCPGIVMLDLP